MNRTTVVPPFDRSAARRWFCYGFLLLAALTMAACTAKQSTHPRSPASSPPPSLSPSPSDTSPAGAALTAYRGMWDAYLRVLVAPNPDSPELARFATGDALKTLTNGVRQVKDKGLKGEGTFDLSPQVTELAPATAPAKIGIRDCVNTTASRIVRASPGPPYSDTPGGRRLCLATVERQSDGAWKVTTFGLREVGSCGQ